MEGIEEKAPIVAYGRSKAANGRHWMSDFQRLLSKALSTDKEVGTGFEPEEIFLAFGSNFPKKRLGELLTFQTGR